MGMYTSLMERFVRLAELLHRHHHQARRRHGPAGDPLRGQGRVMALLKMRPEISQKELGYLLDIRPQSLGELLAKLKRGGFIERTASTQDKRVMDIRLTEAGAAAAEKGESPDGEIITCLSDEEKATLEGLLDRVIDELEAAQDEMDEDEDMPHRHGHGPHCGRGHGPHHGHGRHEGMPHPRHGHGPHGHGGPHGRCCGGKGHHEEGGEDEE
ncbi:MAG: MarR family transcriptional regulator [Planctomycetaceae bacterium]|nr:MarR family transcriptional regulator [Planctomycetaceae bacterium]